MAATHPIPSVVAHEGDLTIRLLRNDRADFALMARWRDRPHVRAWWDPDGDPPTCEQLAAHHGSYLHPSSPTTPCIIEVGQRPVGYVQFYRWASFAGQARAMDVDVDDGTYGIDIHVGGTDTLGRGIGTRTIQLLCDHLAAAHGATGFALTTEVGDLRAQRAYEKAGFTRVREVLDLTTADGERARCWLMTRSA
jgi:RimJ/RimL family protein N-acetyltransferase